jgi:hypothetical protein
LGGLVNGIIREGETKAEVKIRVEGKRTAPRWKWLKGDG